MKGEEREGREGGRKGLRGAKGKGHEAKIVGDEVNIAWPDI